MNTSRFKIIYASSLPSLVDAMNSEQTLFSKVIYFGPTLPTLDLTTAFMAVFDYSYNPVITYEDIMGMSDSKEDSEFDIALSA